MSVLTYLKATANDLLLQPCELDTIARASAALESRIRDYFPDDMFREMFAFGSSTRGTVLPRRADANSDVDYMLVFADNGGFKPQTYMDRLKRFAEDCYPTTEIFQSRPTVVLNLNRRKFELVPAYRGWLGGLKIPARASGFAEWTGTDPNGCRDRLETKDRNHGGEIKQVVRLLKYWNVMNGSIYPSFELEHAVVEHVFWPWTNNLRDRLFSVVDSLSTSELSQNAATSVRNAKHVVDSVRDLEERDFGEYAEQEVTKLIPPL